MRFWFQRELQGQELTTVGRGAQLQRLDEWAPDSAMGIYFVRPETPSG
jgi:hypothetical protein